LPRLDHREAWRKLVEQAEQLGELERMPEITMSSGLAEGEQE